MIAIYVISIFLFVYYFGIGYKRFQTETYRLNKLGLGMIAILLRLFCLKLGIVSLESILNIGIDIVIGFCIYKLAKQYYDEQKSLICTSFYLFNPVILIYACAWGNHFSLWILLIVLIAGCIQKRKMLFACMIFSIAQYYYIGTLFLAPIFIWLIVQYIKEEKHIVRFGKVISTIGLCVMVLSLIDYFRQSDMTFVVNLQKTIFGKYIDYNSCNIWGMVGLNWGKLSISSLARLLIFIDYAVALIIGMFYLNKKWKSSQLGYLYTAFLMSFYGYFFGIGIKDDLFIPTVILALLCFLWSGYKKTYWMYVTVSIFGFCNQIYSCSLYHPEAFKSEVASIILFSFMTLIGLIVITRWLLKDKQILVEGKERIGLIKECEAYQEVSVRESHQINGEISQEIIQEVSVKPSKAKLTRMQKLDKKDYLTMAVLTLVFVLLSLPSLGSHKAPETTFKMNEHTTKEIVLDLGEERQVDHLQIFLGEEQGIKIAISSYDEAKGEWDVLSEDQNVQSVFAWNKVEVKSPIRYLGIVVSNDEAFFNELAVVDNEGNLIMPVDANKYPELFDEQDLYKVYPTYYDQTFFDEVYHARTAYEFMVGGLTYETTHPPLGKILISIGIKLFGMNPFGWRIVVELFGIIMIPLMYIFAKRLFKHYWAATMTTLLLTMDFMHFTLSKISTLDIIIGFWILLMYYFMYRYCQLDLNKEPLKKTFIPLGLCGITMGLGIATKWTGVYAGAGLAVLFFTHIWKAYVNYKGEKKEVTQKIFSTFAFCIGFFIVIPITIYCLSYIPFVDGKPDSSLIEKVLNNAKLMFDYHSKLVATHPYESAWYEWPWMKRPLYQAVTHGVDGMGSAISCFGNPLVWWPGMIAVLYMFKCWFWDKDQKAGFLCIAYAAQLIPWMFVTRCTFIYHYFPCSLFTILCSGYCIFKIMEKYKNGKNMVWGYGVLVILTFAMFYPVISGGWINEESARLWLRWLSGWVMI